MPEPFNAAETTPDEPVVDQAPVEQEASEGQSQEPEEQEDKQVRGNPFARLRILERENKVMSSRFEDLVGRLESKVSEKEDPEPEVHIPDFEENPLAAIHTRQVLMEQKLSKREQQEKEERALQARREIMTFANEAIKDYIEEQPDYQDAVGYLASLEFEEEMDDNPGMSAKQVDNMLLERLNEKKIAWIQAGKNPGHELYKKAVRRGYRPGAKAEKTSEPDAKDQIAAERKRQAQGSSISKAAGRASEGKVTASAIARMSDQEYREWADRVTKERGGGKMKMRDLMGDKVRNR